MGAKRLGAGEQGAPKRRLWAKSGVEEGSLYFVGDAPGAGLPLVAWDLAGLHVEFQLERNPDNVVIRRLVIDTDRAEGINAKELRRIPVGAVWQEANYMYFLQTRDVHEGWMSRLPAQLKGRRGGLNLTPPASGKYPDKFYEYIAAIYADLVEEGRPPVKTLSEANPDIPMTTINRWIAVSRRRGFLPPSRRGSRQ